MEVEGEEDVIVKSIKKRKCSSYFSPDDDAGDVN